MLNGRTLSKQHIQELNKVGGQIMIEEKSFIDELLAEAEQKEELQSEAYADLLIAEVSKLEADIAKNFKTAEEEINIINEWSLKKNSVIQERANLLRLKLENFIKESGKKTIDLANGTLKMRKMPDKVEITDMETFLANANSQMLTVVPEQVKADLTKIKAYLKMTGGKPIAGVTLLEGKEEFRLTLKSQETKE